MTLASRLFAIVAVAVATPVFAQTVYFGENLTPSGNVAGAPVTARNDFLSRLSSTGTYQFDRAGAVPQTINFNGINSAAIQQVSGGTLSGFVCSTSCGYPGRFATSGDFYYESQSDAAIILSFATATSAFGFFGTDIGDSGEAFTVELLRAGATSTLLSIGNTVGAPDGALLFWGVIDATNPFTGVRLSRPASGAFGLDDLTVGEVGRVAVGAAPEPGTWAMMIAGFGIAGVALRRRRKTNMSFT